MYPRGVMRLLLIITVVLLGACRNDEVVTDELVAPLCAQGDPKDEIGYEREGSFVLLEQVGDAPAIVPVETAWNAVGNVMWFRLKGPPPESVSGVFSWYVGSEGEEGADIPVGELPFLTDLVCDADNQPIAFPLQLRIGIERKGPAENYVDDPGRIRLAVGSGGRRPEDCPSDGSDPGCIVVEMPVVYTFSDLVFTPSD